MPDTPPRLNPALDRDALLRDFMRQGHVEVKEVLTRAAAERIHRCLAGETPYGLCVNTDGAAKGLSNLSPQQRQAVTQQAWSQVGLDGFQFLFDQHPLSLNGEPYRDPCHYWAGMMDFLNGPDFLGLTRAVTGLADIAYADAQATLYRAGHFLTAHDDDIPGTHRLAAYVMSFTTAWRPEWGGLLEFIGDDNRITGGYMPDFNSLRLFRVPMSHHVSMVAPFAGAGRYSITGWLRARP